MNSVDPRGIKRKISIVHLLDKRLRSADTEPPLYEESADNILNLSDYTLLHILKFLDTTSLYCLSMTCGRFKGLVQMDSLWNNVDARSPSNTWKKNRYIWKHVNKNTKHILLSASRSINMLMPIEKLIVKKMYSNLSILALEHQCIKYCKLNDFPSTLQELSLRWAFIPRHQEFFRFSLHTMSRLKTLILDHCKWLEATSFMSFCRFQSLEILSLYMCVKLGDDDISSISIAGRLGFKKLKVIDLRFTGLGDLFIRTFYNNTSIQIIYHQNLPATYYMERWQRKIAILQGAKQIEHSYISDDEDSNNISKKILKSRFKAMEFISNNTQSINNSTISYFARVHSSDLARPRPSSFLYRYPYNKCTCGFKSEYHLLNESNASISVESMEDPSEDFNSDEDPSDTECTDLPNCWDVGCLQRKLAKEKEQQRQNRNHRNGSKYSHFLLPPAQIFCSNAVQDSCVSPLWCHEEATPTHVVHNWMHKREPRSEFEMELLTYAEKNFRTINQVRCFNCDCEPDIVVVHTNTQRNFERQFQRARTRNPLAGPCVRETQVRIVIDKMHQFVKWLKRYNYEVDAERVLRGFHKCLDIGDLLAPSDDRTEFVGTLANLLIEFARNKQNIYYVLCYHSNCIRDCMIQLKTTQKVEDKKKVLLHFFKNLVYAEKIGSDTSKECRKVFSPNVKDFIRAPQKCIQSNKLISGELFQNSPFRVIVLQDEKTNITELSLRGFYHVSNAALQVLKELNLQLLDVTGTNVTEQGIMDFLKRNPTCRVIHESACVCTPNLHF